MPEQKFTPAQAKELAAAFAAEDVDYLFIGKSGAILRKRAAGREKDLRRLEQFRTEYQRRRDA